MSHDERRQRLGLEGLPVTDGDVWAFDAVRGAMRGGDRGGLILAWVVGVALAALAIWGRSVGLGFVSAVALALTLWWTATKWRSWIAAQRQMRRIAADEREAP